MAKKAAVKEKINRSSAIKAYMSANKSAKPKEIAEAVSKQLGVEIKPQYVSIVKGQSSKKNGKAKSSKKVTEGQSFGLLLTDAAALIKTAGGIQQAIDTLNAIKRSGVPF